MFRMIIEAQLNIKDRTLNGGNTEYDILPETIRVGNKQYKVFGLSQGIISPKVSLEIQPIKEDLKGQIATAYYEYNILDEYSRDSFFDAVNLIKRRFDSVAETEYIEEPLDGSQIQLFKTLLGEIRVINDFMVGAVWIESETNLDNLF